MRLPSMLLVAIGAALSIVFSGAQSNFPENKNVLLLTEANFQRALSEFPMLLVEFYAPWCGHCRQLEPEYVKAAARLKESGSKVRMAKVDAEKEVALAEKYEVKGFPTLKFFLDSTPQVYTGGRTESSIVSWVTKKTGPPSRLVDSKDDLKAWVKANPLSVVGFFEDADGEAYKAFEAVARAHDEVAFAHLINPQDLDQKDTRNVVHVDAPIHYYYEGIKALPHIRMFTPHDQGRVDLGMSKGVGEEQIEDFIAYHRLPIVMRFSGEVAAEIFSDGRPIVVLFRREQAAEGIAAEQAFRDAAEKLAGRALFTVSGIGTDEIEPRFMEFLGVAPDEAPTVRYIQDPTGAMIKYKLSTPISSESLVSWVTDIEKGRAERWIKSEPIPGEQPGPVYLVVGKTFKPVVINSKKDVLLMLYAPWCGHCRMLEPLYREVAERMANVDSLVIAKMDATANDVEGLDIQGYPTIKFFPANNKATPLDYDGDRDAESFIDFLHKKASIKFGRDEL